LPFSPAEVLTFQGYSQRPFAVQPDQSFTLSELITSDHLPFSPIRALPLRHYHQLLFAILTAGFIEIYQQQA